MSNEEISLFAWLIISTMFLYKTIITLYNYNYLYLGSMLLIVINHYEWRHRLLLWDINIAWEYKHVYLVRYRLEAINELRLAIPFSCAWYRLYTVPIQYYNNLFQSRTIVASLAIFATKLKYYTNLQQAQ